MSEASAPTEAYMSVGEVARRAGVTARTVQYYDQQGVLSPSAKGSHNERLYTAGDLDKLYCVLCLKYAGLSLGEVRAFLEGPCDAAEVFEQAIEVTERDFAELLQRHARLSALRQAAEDARCSACEPDLQEMARAIGPGAAAAQEADDRRFVVSAWHEVIAQAVRLMRRHEPLDSACSRELARKVVALRRADEQRPVQERFSLLEGAAPPCGDAADESFGDLRREMAAYLDRLVGACGEGGARAGVPVDPQAGSCTGPQADSQVGLHTDLRG